MPQSLSVDFILTGKNIFKMIP